MSLQVWLPLNGDLHNQGLKNVSVSSSNSSISTNGKIGSCMKITSNTDLGYSHDFNTTGISFGGWFKFNKSEINSVVSSLTYSSSATTPVGNLIGNNSYGGIGLIWTGNNYYSDNTLSSMLIQSILRTNSTIQSTSGFYVDFDVWIHIFLTWDPDAHILNLYKNGVLVSTKTSVEFSDGVTKNILLNYNAIWGGNGPRTNIPMYCNDIRIYDHALSPLEVKELSKGLVLHYPLNRGGFGRDNLLKKVNHYIYHNSNNSSIYPISREFITESGIEFERIIRTNTSTNPTAFSIYGLVNKALIDKSVAAGMQVTATIWARCSHDQANTKAYLTEIPSSSSSSIVIGSVTPMKAGQWTKFTVTKTLAYSYNDLNAGSRAWDLTITSCNIPAGEIDNYYFDYRQDYKVEIGEESTPWTPNPADDLYSQMGLDNNIVYDTSGYGNNGELYAYDTEGSITVESDTPRYNVSTHIASTNTTTSTATGTRYIYGHCSLTNPTEMTVTFWAKPISAGYRGSSTAGNGIFCTTNYKYGSGSVGTDYVTSAMNHRDGTVDINDSASTAQCRPSLNVTLNEWHHYAITYDGQVGRVYKDGVQSSTAQFSSPKTLDSFIGVVIGFSGAGSAWRSNDAYYSDFRIYATALSAEDVYNLYTVGASISDTGVLFSNEVSEV